MTDPDFTAHPSEAPLRLTETPAFSPAEKLIRACCYTCEPPSPEQLAALALPRDEQDQVEATIREALDIMATAGMQPSPLDHDAHDAIHDAAFDAGYIAASRDFAKVFAAMATANSLSGTGTMCRACVKPAAAGHTGHLLQHFVRECREHVHPGLLADLMDEFSAIDAG